MRLIFIAGVPSAVPSRTPRRVVTPLVRWFLTFFGAFAMQVIFSVPDARGQVLFVDDSLPLQFTPSGPWAVANGEGLVIGVHQSGVNTIPGTAVATWFLTVTNGVWRVSATWSAGSNRAGDAVFTVFEGLPGLTPPLTTAPIDQRQAPRGFSYAGVTWQDLGTFTITSSTVVVQLTNTATGVAIADAIRAEKLSELTP